MKVYDSNLGEEEKKNITINSNKKIHKQNKSSSSKNTNLFVTNIFDIILNYSIKASFALTIDQNNDTPINQYYNEKYVV